MTEDLNFKIESSWFSEASFGTKIDEGIFREKLDFSVITLQVYRTHVVKLHGLVQQDPDQAEQNENISIINNYWANFYHLFTHAESGSLLTQNVVSRHCRLYGRSGALYKTGTRGKAALMAVGDGKT